MKSLKAAAYLPVLGGVLRVGARIRNAAPYVLGPLADAGRWLVSSRELANFTYDLTPLNKDYLVATLEAVTGRSRTELTGYRRELEQDAEVRAHIRDRMAHSRERVFADSDHVEFGRRLGWYLIVRSTKPKVVVETGVDKGMGSCVLCSALLRNAAEGHPGRYYGTDLDPGAGYLLSGRYAQVGKILYGDSIESLKKLGERIDVFINDSDHSAEYEAREYDTVEGMLSDRAVVLGDNSHVTDKLMRFAERTNRQFLFFKEQPANHWYPGAGIGMAFRSPRAPG